MRREVDGFTLIELLVVVVIGAVLAGLVVLTVGNWGSEEDPERQLRRFASLLDVQCELAVFQSRPRGVRLTPAGYDFWQAASSGWVEVPAEGLARARSWPQGLEPRLFVEGRRQALEPVRNEPQIICQPLGELTPFELYLGGGDSRLRLSASAGGRLSLLEDP